MPPKAKISKEDIINTAILMIKNGEELNARSIAAMLECSTQPVFSNFTNMEELKGAVLKRCDEIYIEFTEKEIEKNEYPLYKIFGMAYIEFAKQEKELFKILYMRKADDGSQDNSKLFDKSIELVQKNIGISKEDASLFHLEMWAFVHGIASMHATGYLELEKNLISSMISDVYYGLKMRFIEKEDKNDWNYKFDKKI